MILIIGLLSIFNESGFNLELSGQIDEKLLLAMTADCSRKAKKKTNEIEKIK